MRLADPFRRPTVLVLALAALSPLAMGGCGDDGSSDSSNEAANTTDTSETSTTEAATSTSGATVPEVVSGTEVTIVDYSFSPPALGVEVGETVTWTNSDDFDHTTTADDGALWDSGHIAPGSTFEFTFEEPGTYAYHCGIHNFMTAEVVVS